MLFRRKDMLEDGKIGTNGNNHSRKERSPTNMETIKFVGNS